MPNKLKTQNTNIDVNTQQNNASSLVDANDLSNSESPNEKPSVKEKVLDNTYPIWSVWKKRPCVKLWEAVALGKDINPSKLHTVEKKYPNRYKGYGMRLKTATYWLEVVFDEIKNHPVSGVEPKDRMIVLAEYVKCAEANELKLAPELVKLIRESNQQTKIQNNLVNPKSSDAKSLKDERENKIQYEATEIGLKLQAENKKKNITKVMVAKQLLKEIAANELSVDLSDCIGMSEARIIRIIRKTW